MEEPISQSSGESAVGEGEEGSATAEAGSAEGSAKADGGSARQTTGAPTESARVRNRGRVAYADQKSSKTTMKIRNKATGGKDRGGGGGGDNQTKFNIRYAGGNR